MATTAIKLAKAQHKAALQQPEIYRQKRDNIVRQILNTKTPKWGVIKVQLVNWLKPHKHQ